MRLPPARVDQIFALITQGMVLSKETAAELQGHTEASEELIRRQTRFLEMYRDLIEEKNKRIAELEKQNAALNRLVLVGDEHLKKERAKHATGSSTCNTN